MRADVLGCGLGGIVCQSSTCSYCKAVPVRFVSCGATPRARGMLTRKELLERLSSPPSASLVADPFSSSALLTASLAPPLAKRRRSEQAASKPSQVEEGASVASAALPAATPAATPAASSAAPERLSDDVRATLQALRKSLRDGSLSEEVRTTKCARGLQTLLLLDPAAIHAACDVVGFNDLPDDGVLCACQAASKPDVSGRAAAAFIGAALRPRLGALSDQASRTLFSAMTAMLQQHARPLLDELVVPTLWHRGGALSAGQAEVLARLLRELPEALLGRALSSFLKGEGGQPGSWSEAQVSLLQAALGRKPQLDPACIAELVVQADANVDALRKSLKFANLVSTLVRFHGPLLRSHLPSVRRVAERLDTFMRKSILQALDKLEDAA